MRLPQKKNKIKNKKSLEYKPIYEEGQDLGTVLKCYFLGSSFKIQSCEFFLMT